MVQSKAVKHRLFNIGLFIIYILAMTFVLIWQGIGIAPDRYAFLLLLPALLVRRIRSFILDWVPFLFILISYDFLRSLVPFLNPRVHYLGLIQISTIFGRDLTAWWQQLFFNPQHLAWYDYLATIFYFLHFALPLAFAFVLWLDRKVRFREFTTALLILSYSAWVTYVLFPAAPPWLASQKGFLPGVTKILDLTLQSFPEKLHLPTIYHDFNPNPVAALPSLHAAYPMLVLMFCIRYFKKRGLFFLPYVLGVFLSVIYLGEHYLIDVALGAFYAYLAYLVAILLLHNVKLHTWLKKTTGCYLGWSAVFAKLETILPPRTR